MWMFPYQKFDVAAVGVIISIGVLLYCYACALTISFEIHDRAVFGEPKLLTAYELDDVTETSNRSKPSTRIGFLKVEKASSSTMSGIFFRFGIRHNLTFALPRSGVVLYSYEDLVTKSDDGRFDILAVHASTKKLYDRLLADNYIKIGVIRHPLKRMISAAYFYRDLATQNHRTNYLTEAPKKDIIHNLINKPEIYEGDTPFTLTRNAMGKRFGFSPETSQNDSDVIRRQLTLLNTQFQLVLVTERLEESLVLMKRLLKWTLNDIIYLSKNIHSHELVNITKAEEDKYRLSSFIDYAIYEYFSDILDRKIRSAGNEFQKEVNYFKLVLKEVNTFCEKRSSSALTIERSFWSNQFRIYRSDCKLMGNGNPSIIASLRQKIR